MQEKQTRKKSYHTIIFPICLGLGTALGALIHNIGVGLGIGAIIGTVLGVLGWVLLERNSA